MQVFSVIIDSGSVDDEASGSLEELARVFKALGDPNRLKLLFELMQSRDGKSVGEAAACCAVDLSVVSRHLKQLEETGILSREKLGKEVYYRVDSQQVPAALRNLADAITSCCADTACSTDPDQKSNKE